MSRRFLGVTKTRWMTMTSYLPVVLKIYCLFLFSLSKFSELIQQEILLSVRLPTTLLSFLTENDPVVSFTILNDMSFWNENSNMNQQTILLPSNSREKNTLSLRKCAFTFFYLENNFPKILIKKMTFFF